MFKFLFQRSKPKPVFDPTLGDPLAKKVLHEARQGKLDTFLTEVNLLRNGKWDQRAFYVNLAGEHLHLEMNSAQMPDTPLSNLVKGVYHIHDAWNARGSGRADTVSEQGWDLFFERLELARVHLLRAGEQDSDDPTPFAFLQTVAMGLQLEPPTADLWFYEAVQRDRFNQQAHYRKLFFLCKKWGGSHEAMYSFARQTLTNLPERSTLHALLYLAFQEHFLYLSSFDRDIDRVRDLIRGEKVQAESTTVYEKSFKKRQRIENVADYWPHNVVVWWFLVLDIPEVVRQETKKIGPYFTEFPWMMFYKDAASGYQKALNR